jgi:hypothetical protein
MGTGIGAVYSVPLDELRALPGSGDRARKKKLARMIVKDFIGREDVDEMFSEQFDDPPNTMNGAVQQILNGEPLLEDRGGLYGYAVEGLCWAIGSTFFLPIGFPGHEALDEFLTAHGSPVTLERLLFSGFPLPIPEPESYPMAGVWEPPQVIAASAFLATLPRAKGDLEVGIAEVRAWVAEAVKHETDGLVGFWY